MEKVFILEYDMSHLIDMENDIFHVPFKEGKFFSALILSSNEFPIPSKILFQGDSVILNTVDYLVNDLNAPVFSNKLVGILKSCGHFQHRSILCGIVDYRIPAKDAFSDYEEGILKSGIKPNFNFQLLHVQEHLNIFDYEKSIYTRRKSNPEKLSIVEKFVFNAPVRGYPPIFRVREDLSLLFVTEKVKEKCEKEGLGGLIFKEI